MLPLLLCLPLLLLLGNGCRRTKDAGVVPPKEGKKASATPSPDRRPAPPPEEKTSATPAPAASVGDNHSSGGAEPAPHFAVRPIETRVGRASWYDVPAGSLPARRAWHAEFTAAHDRWPLGTYARVTALENGRSVIVRVTDRGIHQRGTIIDVSRPAAAALDMLRVGRLRVRVERLALSVDSSKIPDAKNSRAAP
ncbi:MAG: hypothetical protein JO295_09950 [Verrucomicrobia bacterium]|nr:hypothetical protein [Verrucomicrobiota bacterium]